MLKKISTVMVALTVTLSLSACNPPIPPELLAALAEESYTCESGDLTMSLPNEIADLGYGWSEAITMACPDLTLSTTEAPADLEVATGAVFSKECEAFASVPFALDAAVVGYALPEIDPLNLDAEALAGILTGAISSWDDPKLVSLNTEMLLPALPIELVTEAPEVALGSINSWLEEKLGQVPAGEVLGPAKTETDFLSLAEGSLFITSFSRANLDFLQMATLLDPNDPETTTAFPDILTISATGSQLEDSVEGGKMTAKRNPELEIVAPEGFDVASNPYPAVYTVDMGLCGTDNLASRAAARFLLRLDQQGAIAASTMVPLPEPLRISALALVSKGLPEPEIPEDFGQ